jgi:hypothetical protein
LAFILRLTNLEVTPRLTINSPSFCSKRIVESGSTEIHGHFF